MKSMPVSYPSITSLTKKVFDSFAINTVFLKLCMQAQEIQAQFRESIEEVSTTVSYLEKSVQVSLLFIVTF